MKVTVNEKSNGERKYPWIGINDETNDLVLFYTKFTGTVLISPNYGVGFSSNSWLESAFKPFTGEITLSND